MPRPAIIHFISAQPLWLQVCSQILRGFRRELEVIPVTNDLSLKNKVQYAIATGNGPDLAIISLDTPTGELDPVRAVRDGGYIGPILVLCSRYDLPNRRDILAEEVQGVVSSLQSLEELEESMYTLLDNQPESLLQQHLRIAQAHNRNLLSRLLSERERNILRLVAEDLTDKEIAERLDISTRTVSLHLGHIYAKLGVKGRAGAAAVGIIKGLI